MVGKYHVKIGGQGFLVRPGSYRRSAGGNGSGWKRWTVSGWQRGDGVAMPEKTGGFASGYGIEIGTPGRLSLARETAVSYASAEDGLAALVPFQGKLYAASKSSGKVFQFDGAAWSLAYTAPVARLRSAAVAYGELMIGSGADGKIFSFDPYLNAWGPRFDAGAALEIGAMAPVQVYEAATKLTVPRLAVGVGQQYGEAELRVYSGDGVNEQTYPCGESRVEALAGYRGRLYVATCWGSPSGGGRLLALDGVTAERQGEMREVAAFGDNYVAGLAVFEDRLYLGMARGGLVLVSDGSGARLAYDLGAHGASDPGELRGLAVVDGRLAVGYRHPSTGAALLRKLPGGREDEGWYTEAYTGQAGAVRALGGYGGELYLARDAAGAAQVHSRSGPAYGAAGRVELSPFDGGDPSAERLLNRVAIAHAALRAGELVRVSHRLEDEGAWSVLGTSDVEGATAAEWSLPAGTVARRLGLRVELEGASSAAGPELTGVALEYAEAGSGRRRWEMEVRCEGVPGVLPRLLDGSAETLTGAELSAALWGAKALEVVGLEDLDGVAYSVRFEGLEERLAEMAQERGPQTWAKCRLVER